PGEMPGVLRLGECRTRRRHGDRAPHGEPERDQQSERRPEALSELDLADPRLVDADHLGDTRLTPPSPTPGGANLGADSNGDRARLEVANELRVGPTSPANRSGWDHEPQ